MNTSDELLDQVLDQAMDKIAAVLKNGQFKAVAALIEAFIQIMFHVEDRFEPYASKFIPILIEQIQSNDTNTQKVSIDAFNALATTCKEHIIQFRVDILQALKPIKSHKVKPVRDASLYTIKLLRELDPPLGDKELAILDELPTTRRLT